MLTLRHSNNGVQCCSFFFGHLWQTLATLVVSSGFTCCLDSSFDSSGNNASSLLRWIRLQQPQKRQYREASALNDSYAFVFVSD